MPLLEESQLHKSDSLARVLGNLQAKKWDRTKLTVCLCRHKPENNDLGNFGGGNRTSEPKDLNTSVQNFELHT